MLDKWYYFLYLDTLYDFGYGSEEEAKEYADLHKYQSYGEVTNKRLIKELEEGKNFHAGSIVSIPEALTGQHNSILDPLKQIKQQEAETE